MEAASGDGAAGGLDLGLRGGAAGHLHDELLGELALGEDLHLGGLVVREAGLGEGLDGDLGASLELLLEVGEVHRKGLVVEAGVVEPALG